MGAGGESDASQSEDAGIDDAGWETVTKKSKKKKQAATNGGVKQGLDAVEGENKE